MNEEHDERHPLPEDITFAQFVDMTMSKAADLSEHLHGHECLVVTATLGLLMRRSLELTQQECAARVIDADENEDKSTLIKVMAMAAKLEDNIGKLMYIYPQLRIKNAEVQMAAYFRDADKGFIEEIPDGKELDDLSEQLFHGDSND